MAYNQEFFDREYSAKEAYGRLWKFARRYKFRMLMGVVCGTHDELYAANGVYRKLCDMQHQS